MVNMNKINVQIQKTGISFAQIAEKLGIDTEVLDKKLHQKDGEILTVREAHEIVKILKLPREQASDIFFCQITCENARNKEGRRHILGS